MLPKVRDLPGALARRARWRQLLRSCDFDPDRTEQPLRDLGPNDFIIAGCPRSGTSLLAALLFQPPEVVTCVEPWDGLRVQPADLFASLRADLDRGVMRRGRLDLEALVHRREVAWQRDGERSFPLDLSAEYALGVKWPSYWRYLDHLHGTRFLICVRNPSAVLQSFASVGGRLEQGLEYDVAMHDAMNRHLAGQTRDPARRRALLIEYISSRVAPALERDNVFAVRYERWFEDPAGQLRDIGAFLGRSLSAETTVDLRPPSRGPSADLITTVRELVPSAAALGYEY